MAGRLFFIAKGELKAVHFPTLMQASWVKPETGTDFNSENTYCDFF
jgi:hypothetical protein